MTERDDLLVHTELSGEVALPQGFKFAAVRCGIKQGRPDLALLVSDPPAATAGVFTQNPARAACVERNGQLVPAAGIKAVVINSGNANAMTGVDGARANTAIAEELAKVLKADTASVLTASTGVIGVPLVADMVNQAIPALVDGTGPDPAAFAQAILTTDTRIKVASIELQLGPEAQTVRIFGVAKGSGMIHPNMATTLAFVCTDAAVAPEALQRMLSVSVDETFNGISVDGDTSTNDMVLVLANGTSGIHVEGADHQAQFAQALDAVLASLARQVVLDGEGATRIMEVEVTGAPDKRTARLLARGVCRSSLVKCSTFAGQPDWGRVASALGQTALEHELAVKPTTATIYAQGIELYQGDGPCVGVKMAEVHRRMREPVVRWTIALGQGDSSFTALGCDLSYDYVRINADDSPQIEVSTGGGVRRNLSLGAYSPRLKHQLLAEGLSYVRRFMGLRMLVYVPPGIEEEVDLKSVDNLSKDLELCLNAGLRPLLVVPSEQLAGPVQTYMEANGYVSMQVASDPTNIGRLLDRGHLCIMIRTRPEPKAVVDLAIKLGMQKLVALVPEAGVRDAHGFVQRLSPDSLLMGMERDRFAQTRADTLVLAKHAATQGVPALHIVDARLPHTLVGELFTDEGTGTLMTRMAIG